MVQECPKYSVKSHKQMEQIKLCSSSKGAWHYKIIVQKDKAHHIGAAQAEIPLTFSNLYTVANLKFDKFT